MLGLLFLIGGLLLLLSLTGMALVEAVYAFIIGIRIAADNQVLSIPDAFANNFLVINLCEPLVNMILITRFGLGNEHALVEQPIARSLWLTAPMLFILGLPILGLLFKAPYYRKKCVQILVLGLARWPIVFTAWVSVGAYQSSPWGLIIPTLMFPLGLKVLWSSVAMGQRELARLKSGTTEPVR